MSARYFTLVVASLTAGCTLLTATPPTAQVEAVQLQGIGLLDQSLAVTLCVINPNDAALNFHRVTVGVDVAGAPLAQGVSEVNVRLPPHAATRVPFAVTTTVLNLGPQLLGVLRAGAVPYRLHGTVQLAGPFAITLPFGHTGRLDASALSQAMLADTAAPGTTDCHRAVTGSLAVNRGID